MSSIARSVVMSGGTHTGSRFMTSPTAIVAERRRTLAPAGAGSCGRRPGRQLVLVVLDRHVADPLPVHQVGGQVDRVVLGAR